MWEHPHGSNRFTTMHISFLCHLTYAANAFPHSSSPNVALQKRYFHAILASGSGSPNHAYNSAGQPMAEQEDQRSNVQ
jgi:hypothetical protein